MGFSEEWQDRVTEKSLWSSNQYMLTFKWPFVKYKITEDRIFVEYGVLKTIQNETRLYRVTDLRLSQNLIQRMCGTSTIEITTRDKDTPLIFLKNIKQGYEVKELLSQLVEESRRKNRVITTDSGMY